MCGRYTRHHDTAAVTARFGVQHTLFDEAPRFNIAPTQPVAVVVTDHRDRSRVLDAFRWGLVPSWAKDVSIGSRMINARSESVAEKPAFKRLLAHRRCVLPADGFYEWDKAGGTRQPYLFRRADGDLLGFAGLWDDWLSPDGSSLLTCTILTTAANDTVGAIHDRMPVILRRGSGGEDLWLDPSVTRTDALLPLLLPYPDAEMERIAVSRRVNTPTNDDAGLLEPSTVAESARLQYEAGEV